MTAAPPGSAAAALHEARRAALRRRLAAESIPALLVTALPDVRYLSGFTGSSGAVLVTADGEDEAFATDGRYAEQAAAEVSGLPLVVDRTLAWLPPRVGSRALAVDAGAVTWAQARALQQLLAGEVLPAGALVAELRRIKDASEIASLRRAAAIADQAFTAVLPALAPGVSERAVARMLHVAMSEAGAEDTSHLIVAGGPSSARPHHRPTGRPLAGGELVLMDFGCVVDGYHSDMTRTVALGDPGRRLRQVHELVAQAQAEALAAATAGVTAGELDASARRVIAAAGLGEQFVHPTGHGLGLELHEQPILAAGAGDTLQPHTAVTVEPGVYLAGLGGVRIEDDIVITDGPADVLTTSPRELLVL